MVAAPAAHGYQNLICSTCQGDFKWSSVFSPDSASTKMQKKKERDEDLRALKEKEEQKNFDVGSPGNARKQINAQSGIQLSAVLF